MLSLQTTKKAVVSSLTGKPLIPKKIVIFANMTEYQQAWAKNMQQGFERHGQKARIVSSAAPQPCELAVIWGVRRTAIIEQQRKASKDYLVMERGYFGDRFQMTSLAFNGLNGRGEFYNHRMLADRWNKHGVEIKDWKHTGDYALLIGQVLGDMSLANVDIGAWYKRMLREIPDATGLPIRFRPHPSRPYVLAGQNSYIKPLAEDLAHAALVVTMNSNVGIDAVLSGVPCVSYDVGAMARSMTSHDVRDALVKPNREQWANDLAYCQWTAEEIASGEAWEHLKQRYVK